jgi:hypothetical protein
MTFDMDKFLARCEQVLKDSNRSPVTLSKKLFGNPSALPRLIDKTGSARFDSLIEAEQRLRALEQALESKAA